MKVYLGSDKKIIPVIKRLVKLKADLGLCAWANDFSDCDFDISELMDIIEKKLDCIKNDYAIVKELTDDEDMEYFESVNEDESVKRLLETGILDREAKEELGNSYPSLLKDVIDKVSDSCFIWIV